MPTNLTKVYNQMLELDQLSQQERTRSLRRIFDRDFVSHGQNRFKGKPIDPISKDGVEKMEGLFNHLTSEVVDKRIRSREYEPHRSKRLHWIRYHITERNPAKIQVFSCLDKEGVRTYIYDDIELYVIVLEPLRDYKSYYLLSAYHLRGKDKYRIRNKMARKLNEVK